MKLVPGSRERSTSVLTPPTLSSTPLQPPSTPRGPAPPLLAPLPPPLVPVPRRRIVKPLFSAGQPDKRREDAFLFSFFFLFFSSAARVPSSGTRDRFRGWLSVARKMLLLRGWRCYSRTIEGFKDVRSELFFDRNRGRGKWYLCVCYRSCNGYTVYCSMESWKRVFKTRN